MKNNNKGFTLVELMIVVAIIGIIAMFAIPSYQNSQRKARITEGIAQLTELQSNIEKARLEGRVPYGAITLDANNNGIQENNNNRTFLVRHSGNINYNNQIIYTVVYNTVNAANKYTLTAVAQGTWIANNHPCRTLTMDGNGNLEQRASCP